MPRDFLVLNAYYVRALIELLITKILTLFYKQLLSKKHDSLKLEANYQTVLQKHFMIIILIIRICVYIHTHQIIHIKIII